MANEQNLIKNEDLTPSERRANASKAGKASAEARRKKRDLRIALELLLDREYKASDGKTMSGAEAIAAKQMEKALNGDTRAFEVIRDTSGQKPIEKVAISEVDADIVAEVENIVLNDTETSD